MSEALLTVAIPTYRRMANLKSLLESFSVQSNPKYKILIADDYPEDATEMKEMIERFNSTMKNITLLINEKNVGYSANVCQLYERADTRYIWFLCDDDTVHTDCIDAIISKLEKNEPSVAIFNYSWVDSYGVYGQAGVIEDKIYTSKDSLTDYNVLMRLTFLSNLVMERLVPTEQIKGADYTDNVFFQITLGLQILTKRMRLAEFTDSILHRNVGFKYGEFIKFYLLDHLKAIMIAPHMFDNDKFLLWSKRHLLNAFKLYMSQKIGLFYYKGVPTAETLSVLYKYYGTFWARVVLLFPVIYRIVPTVFIKTVYMISLINRHGFRKAQSIYSANLNRAFIDKRQTIFTEYK